MRSLVAYNKSNWNDTTLVSIVTLTGTESVAPGAAAVVPRDIVGTAVAAWTPQKSSHSALHAHPIPFRFMTANIVQPLAARKRVMHAEIFQRKAV